MSKKYVELTPDDKGLVIGPHRLYPTEDGTLMFIKNGVPSGVAHFVRTTKPTTRIDGSALVVGDRWYKANDGTEWFWNGTYWLSSTEYTVGFASRSLTANHTPSFANTFVPDWDFSSQLFFTKYKSIYTLGTADASNYWEVGILRLWNGYDIGSIVRLNTPATEGVVTATLNVVGIIRLISGFGFGVRIYKIGNPSTLDINQAWTYRRIAE